MPNYDDDDIIIPDGFNVETGKWEDDAQTAEDQTPTTEPAAEAVADTEAAQPEATTPEEVKPQTIRVKYNHEERELGLDEAATYAQKGMNYDKLEERVKAFEAANARSAMLAKRLGYDSTEEMIAAEQNFFDREVQTLVDAGNTEAMARFLVEQKYGKATEPAVQTQPVAQEQPTPAESKPQISEARMAELEEFVKAYPGVTTLPDEVLRDNKNGVRLLVAYERFKNKAALNELAILKQNQAAAAKAPVSGATGKGAAAPEKNEANDPFLRGFNSDPW